VAQVVADAKVGGLAAGLAGVTTGAANFESLHLKQR